MSYYKTSLTIETKSDQTPLTVVDKKAHQQLVDGLSQITSNIPILSEESELPDFSVRSNWDEYWLMDPLDGTRDFIEQTGEFCICIAYIKENRPIYGFIYAPLSKTHYFTNEKSQAFKLSNNTTTLLQVGSKKEPLEVVIGHHSSHNSKLNDHLNELGECNISHLGSALKFCKIAEGEYDYYPRFGPCSEWDTAAGACILEAAGGQVIGEDSQPLRYNTKDDLSSPVFFASGKA